MVVVFPLLSDRANRDGLVVDDLEQGNVACKPEGNDQLAKERTPPDLAARERKPLEQLHRGFDGLDRATGKIQIAAIAGQFALNQEIEEAQEVVLRLCG